MTRTGLTAAGRALLGLASSVACVLWMLACSDGGSGVSCPVGTESCRCTEGGACDPGLSCLSKVCVSASASGDLSESGGGDRAEGDTGSDLSCSDALLADLSETLTSDAVPLTTACRDRAASWQGDAVSVSTDSATFGEPDGRVSDLPLHFDEGTLKSFGGNPCVPITPERMFDDPGLRDCLQYFACGCCAVQAEWWELSGWWLHVSQTYGIEDPECDLPAAVYEAFPSRSSGGSGESGECRTDSNCGRCERCSDGVCRACGSGPSGCYC